jgi:hypothetical protein
MNKIKLTVVALATAGVGLVGVNTAFAGTPHTAPKAPAVHPATDGDNVQQGDQTTPDVPGAVEAPEATSTTSARQSASVTSAPAASATGETPGTETPDATESSASESGTSDGNDGGHADPEGVDVNHVGGADEK